MAKLFNALDFANFKATNVANSTANGDGVNKGQMDTAIAAAIAGINIAGNVIVNGVETSLFDYLTTSGYIGGTFPIAEGSIIILTAAPTGSNRYVQNGGTALSTADFSSLDNVLSQSDVRAMLSAGQGIRYSNGQFSALSGFTQIVGDGAQTSFTITNQSGEATARVGSVLVRETASGAVGEASVTTAGGDVTVVFGTAPGAGAMEIVVGYVYVD